MKKSLYLYLQRYLLKVLTQSKTSQKFYIPLVTPLQNRIENQEKVRLLTLNFLKNDYIKRKVDLNSNFYRESFLSFNNKPFFFVFVKNSNTHYNYVIKTRRFIKGFYFLSKENFFIESSFFSFFAFLKLKKTVNFFVKSMICDKQVMFFYFSTHKKQNFINLFTDLEESKQIQSLSFLNSFFFLLLFLSKQLSINKESNLVYLSTLFCIAFPLKVLTKGFKKATNKTFLDDKTGILITNLFLLTFKYVKKKKLIQVTSSKVFVYIVNRLFFYQFYTNNLTDREKKTFASQRVLNNSSVKSYFFLMRPLFSLTRVDTFYICESLKLPIYPDQSNFRVDFLRNRVRKQILPAIRILLNPQFDTILCKFNDS